MKNINKKLIFSLLFFCSYYYSAHGFHTPKLHFSGIIKDAKNREINFIGISYVKNDNFLENSDDQSTITKVDEDGHFAFELNDLGKPFEMGFSLKKTEIGGGLGIIYKYITESGDNIQMEIRLGENDTITFSGNGSQKYDLIQNLREQDAMYQVELNKLNIYNYKNAEELIRKLDSLSALTKTYDAKSMLLINNQGNVNPNMKNIIRYKYTNYFLSWSTTISWMLYKTHVNDRQQLKEYYLAHKDEFYLKPIPESILSGSYMNALMEIVRFEIKIKDLSDSVDLLTFYNAVKGGYTGIVRDRLLASFAFSPMTMFDISSYKPEVMDSILLDAEKYVQTFYLKKALSETLRIKSGSKLYEASFTDLNGKEFHISDLRGKVVLIDFWFIGCTGCAQMHAFFEKNLYPELKNNRDFVFLSINMDKKKENWLKGMKSGLYTSSSYINVGTETGLNHPFLKYYNVLGGPFVMLINMDGNIQSRIDMTKIFKNKNYLLKLIEEASRIEKNK